MNKVSVKLTVFFEQPFWVGIMELVDDDGYKVHRIVFGSEPKEAEVYMLLMNEYDRFIFSSSMPYQPKEQHVNPKRMQRDARKEMQKCPVSTKSQIAMKLLQEAHKLDKKVKRTQENRRNATRKFEQKTHKKKEKRKGH